MKKGGLLVTGELSAGELRLSFEDCRAFRDDEQIPDVGAYAHGIRGKGVRLAAILDLARVHPSALFLNIRNRSGTFAAVLFRAEVAELGIVVYELDGAPIPSELGGPFRFVLPGFHDEARDVADVACLELSRRPGLDTRAAPWDQIQFGPVPLPAEEIAPAASPRSFLMPRP